MRAGRVPALIASDARNFGAACTAYALLGCFNARMSSLKADLKADAACVGFRPRADLPGKFELLTESNLPMAYRFTGAWYDGATMVRQATQWPNQS